MIPFGSFVRSAAFTCTLLAPATAIGLLCDVASAQAPAAATAANAQFSSAANLHNLNEYGLAADEWSKFIKDFPQDKRVASAYYYLGICKLQLKDNDAAGQMFEKVIGLDPKYEAGGVQLNLGLAQFNSARAGKTALFAAAEKTFADALKAFPTGKHVPQALYYQAEALYAQEKRAPAVDLYRRFVTEFAADQLYPDALYALGVTLDELDRGKEADAVYVEFLTKFPQHALRTDVEVHRAEWLSKGGNVEEAEKLFAAAAAKPGYEDADYALLRQAGCLYDRKQYEAAATTYDSLPTRFPQSEYKTAAQLAAGKSHFYAGNYPVVAAKLTPLAGGKGEVAAEAAHWAGRALIKSKRTNEAFALLATAIKNTPTSKFASQLALDSADALYEQPQRRAEALAAYKAIFEKTPNDQLAPQARYLAAFTALELQRYDEAQTLAAEFLKNAPSGDASGANFKNEVLFIRAEALLLAGKYDAATAAYDELLAAATRHPDRAKWIVRRALSLSLAGKHDAVLQALTKQIDALGEPTLKADALRLVGLSRQAMNDHSGAITDLRASLAAASDRPNSDDTQLALAESSRLAGDNAGAQAALSEFFAKYPQSKLRDTAEFRSAELAYAADDRQAAEAAYRRVLDSYPQSILVPYARYGLASTLLSRQDAAGAITAFDALLKSNPPAELAAKARYRRGVAHQQLKQWDLAIADLDEFLKSKPTLKEQVDALHVLGLCQEGAGKNDAALATFEKLLAADPKYEGAPKVLYEIGWIRKNAGQTKESAAAFARLSTGFPKNELAPEAFFHVGEEAYERKDYTPAYDAYYESFSKEGVSPVLAEKAIHKLGWTAFHLSRFDKAEEWFKYQVKNHPDGKLAQDALFMEGEALYKQKKYKEAIDAYARVKTPQNPEFTTLALVHAGQAASQMEDWKTALQYLDAAVEKDPQSPQVPEINYERGFAKHKLGAIDEAVALYEKVTEATDLEVAARARFMVGEINFDKKNHAEAVKHFFKVAYGYAYPQWQSRAQFEAGRCFEVLGKLDSAKKSYEEIVKNFPQSADAELAKKQLAKLGQ